MDDTSEIQRHARSFGSVAEAYERGRPSFPREAAAWLAGDQPVTVLELGAGTGKLTRELVALGHDVHASDPDPAMLEVLVRQLPDVRVSESGAEEIPLPDRSVDVVVAAQSFHWFDHGRALPEIARVLRPGGHVALAWNTRDERIPWVRRLGRLIGSQEQGIDESAKPLVLSELFGFVDEATFPFWQQIDQHTLRDLVLSRSNVASLDEAGRAAKLAVVAAVYAEFGRGIDGMQLPYDCRCFRAVVTERPEAEEPEDETGEPVADDTVFSDPAAPTTRRTDGSDTEMLLIDFR
jgi:ubiquinone/menaquinone biosynthesis C-methylase UbiE